MLNTIIDEKLQALGITKNYKGYHQLKQILILALEDESRLLSVSKNIFKPLADQYGCSVCSFSRNIRTLADKIWNDNYNKLCEMARYDLPNAPTVCELIAILVADIQRSETEGVKKWIFSQKSRAVYHPAFVIQQICVTAQKSKEKINALLSLEAGRAFQAKWKGRFLTCLLWSRWPTLLFWLHLKFLDFTRDFRPFTLCKYSIYPLKYPLLLNRTSQADFLTVNIIS